MDYSKLLKVMLKGAHEVEELQENGQWMLTISNGCYTMRMRLHVDLKPLKAMRYGVPTWSLRVTNSEDRQVMFASNLNPSVAKHLARLIEDEQIKNEKVMAKDDWTELEDYIG